MEPMGLVPKQIHPLIVRGSGTGVVGFDWILKGLVL